MIRWLAVFTVLAAGLTSSVRADDPCAVPGTIDFFTLNSLAGASGACDARNHQLLPSGPVSFGVCSFCGLGAKIPTNYSDSAGTFQGDASFLYASSGLVAALSGQVAYTIEMDYATIPSPNGDYPSNSIFGESGSDFLMGASTGGDGRIEWDIDVPQGSVFEPSVFLNSDVLLQTNQCYHLSFISDGTAYYIYVDGELAGGPLVRDTSRPARQIDNVALYANGPRPAYFRNVRFSTQANFNGTMDPIDCTPVPTETPTGVCQVAVLKPPDITFGAPHTVIQTCTMVPTGTLTWTPTPSPMAQTETLTPTETPSPSPSATVTVTSTPAACSTCSNPVTRLSQGASAWKQTQLDDTNPALTIGAKGCLLTCVAMLDHSDPGTLNTTFTQDNLIVSGGPFNGDLKLAPAVATFKWEWDGVETPYDPTDTQWIVDDLCNGIYLIANMKRANTDGHFVVITGVQQTAQGCTFKIADPGNGNNVTFESYTNFGGSVVGIREIDPNPTN